MKPFIFSSSSLWSYSICVLRIWCGVIFVKYGSSVLHPGSVDDFAGALQTVDIPFPLWGAWLCKSTELLGGILLIIGLFMRSACILLIIDMSVATFVFHHGQVLNSELTTFLLLLCLIHILSGKSDSLTMDYLTGQK